jgi:hypothetical protein
LDSINDAYEELKKINENDVASKEHGYSIIEKHQKLKKDTLEGSLVTFEDGKELLNRIKEMSMCVSTSSSADKNKTKTICCSIELLIETLNDKRLHLENVWQNRKYRLECCIQLSYLRQEIKKV